MSGPFGSSSFNHLVSSGFYNGVIESSVRFDRGSSTYLSQNKSSDGDTKTMTFSWWMKVCSLDSTGDPLGVIYNSGYSGGGGSQSGFNINFSNQRLNIVDAVNNSAVFQVIFSYHFSDPSAWYNCVVVIDTTESTNTNRVKLFVNGTQQTNTDTANWPSENATTRANKNLERIGAGDDSGSPYNHTDIYLADFNLIDGTALTPSSFGEFNNGIWIPIDTSELTFGSKGWRLQFKQTGDGQSTASSSTIGADTSGNNLHFNDNSMDTHDSNMPDCPENNFPTVNSLEEYGTTVSEGDLKFTTGTSTAPALATFSIPTSGKWYWEVYVVTVSDMMIGVQNRENVQSTGYSGRKTVYYRQGGSGGGSGSIYIEGTGNGGDQSAYGNGDVVAVVYNADDMKISWRVNGTQEGLEFDVTDTDVAPIIYQASGSGSCSGIFNFGQDDTFAGALSAGNNADAKGIGNFKYAPPSGYLALCSANLPTPTIGPNKGTQSDDHFNTVLYTGNGSTQSITGVGFQPDWLWIKSRSTTDYHGSFDSSRGSTKRLFINETDAETTQSAGVTSFDSDGFSLGSNLGQNRNTATFVAWNWKGNGGTTVSDGNGSITSTVQANTTAGFSIVLYTGNATAGATVGHGLGAAPDWYFIKRRSNTGDWLVYHSANTAAPETDFLKFNENNATEDNNVAWNDVAPTSTVFSLGSSVDVNANSETYVAYCFRAVEGYSRFGTYTGNGNANGPFVYTDFRPALVIIKQTNSTNNWRIVDNKREGYNGDTEVVYPSVDNAAGSEVGPDILSNGFKLRADTAGTNANSGTFIYMAFAEQPFKFSNAR